MTVRSSEGRWPEDATDDGRGLPVLDITVANPARMWDYWLGGKDHFAADREAARRVQEVLPSVPEAVLQCRRFLAQAVRRLAADYGVRQFLDIGTGLPTACNLHELARESMPGARVVYVDFDPMVAAHARALLVTDPEARTGFVLADLRETKTVLTEAAETLDFGRPAGVVLTSVLHFVPADDDPHRIVGQLMDAVPAGSFLVIVHGASDTGPETVGEGTRRYNELSSTPVTFRSRAEVTRFFDGLDILDTGSGPGRLGEIGHGQPAYCGIGRKP
jgi:hypothetical protein